MKKLILIFIFMGSLLGATRENLWVKSVVELIPYDWELNKTTCKKIKRKMPLYAKQEESYLYGNSDNIYVWCDKKSKKMDTIRFFNNKHFKQVKLDKSKGDLFIQSSKYYNKQNDDFVLSLSKDNQTVYGHRIYYGENIVVYISDDTITISFDDSEY